MAEPGNSHPDHAAHDPELVAALLDRDLAAPERAAGQALVDHCAACRDLLTELRALAAATVAHPLPARSRAFTLSPQTAADLRRQPAGEPVPAPGRLGEAMHLSSPGHDAHDRILIASLVDRSIGDPERALAEQQLAACRACAQLHDELVALASATRALPVPARPRDFVLSPADAHRLRGPWWRRVAAAIGSSRDVFSRPLAIGFTTLGLAGLLVANVPLPFATGGATSAERAMTPIEATTEDGTGAAGSGEEFVTQASGAPLPAASAPSAAMPAPSAAPSAPIAEAAPAPSAADVPPDGLFVGGDASPLPGEPATDQNLFEQAFATDNDAAPSSLTIVAGLLLLLGLGLFALRWTARRLGDG